MLDSNLQSVPASQPSSEAAAVPCPTTASATEQPGLFSAAELQAASPPSQPASAPVASSAAPRINKPERFQGELRTESLDERLDADHPVRLVWSFVENLHL